MTTIEPWHERRSGIHTPRAKDNRSPYERDRARVIHSAAFRRLQAKTQVLGISEGDFHRTRLTHSMEVAQVARGLVHTLHERYPVTGAQYSDAGAHLPTVELIETIAFCHDLGHPPFGHGGEVALNYMMRAAGGFEGNGQSLRVLARLEPHTEHFGLDLTRRTLLGILKYPAPYEAVIRRQLPAPPEHYRQLRAKDWKPPKCYMSSEDDVVSWLLERLPDTDRTRFTSMSAADREEDHGVARFKALDTSIMEIADDIAYGIHDLEDGIALGLITTDHWDKVEGAYEQFGVSEVGCGNFDDLKQELFCDSSHSRKKAIGGLVHALISSVELSQDRQFTSPLLAYNAKLNGGAACFLTALKKLTTVHIVRLHSVQTLEYRGQVIVMSLFEAIASDPHRLMPPSSVVRYQAANDQGSKLRVVCDYVAGMTDSYAARMYERLFLPGYGNVFERL